MWATVILAMVFQITVQGLDPVRLRVLRTRAQGGEADEDPRAVVLVFSGATGQSFVSESSEGARLVEELAAGGAEVLELAWDKPWWYGPEGAGLRAYSLRPAAAISAVLEAYSPSGVPLVYYGQSGGASAIAGAIELAGADLPDRAVLSGGPPHADMARSCLAKRKDGGFVSSKRALLDRAYGYGVHRRDLSGPCFERDADFEPAWIRDSPARNVTPHPGVDFRLLLGELDDSGVATAAMAYRDALEDAGNQVALEVVPKTPHRVYSTEAGRQALLEAILGGF